MADNLRKYKSLFSSTTNSFGTGEAVTITPASVVGLPTTTEIVLTFDRVDSAGTASPSAMERILGTISGGNFVVSSGGRGYDGSTEQAHTSPVVEMIWNAADWNSAITWALVEHSQDGKHTAITGSSVAVSGNMSASRISASDFVATRSVSASTITASDITATRAMSASTITASDITATRTLSGPIAINAQTASYLTVLADANKLIQMNVGSANNLSAPVASNVAYATGTKLFVQQLGAGATTIVAAGGVTINNPAGVTKVLKQQHSLAALVKYDTNSWFLAGDLTAS